MTVADAKFGGSIPQLYDRLLVPLIFQPYADDLAARVARVVHERPARVLEIAAGTGVVTRALAQCLPPSSTIVATDLNQAMLDQAIAAGTAHPVRWQQADAMSLPFPDAAFDVVVCQFGAMFFPDKAAAYAEARRVLRPGGQFVFNVWDRIEDNDFAQVVTDALAQAFPLEPPRFLARTPHGYHDLATIADDLARAGFTTPPVWSTLAARSRAVTPDVPAIAYCQGTPLRNEIAASRLAEATALAAAAIAQRFGAGPVDGKIQAHVIAVARP
jgi:ubiquinone/menaquinone biosynthesis C-methylase UbiE